jgi:hypothetical protein
MAGIQLYWLDFDYTSQILISLENLVRRNPVTLDFGRSDSCTDRILVAAIVGFQQSDTKIRTNVCVTIGGKVRLPTNVCVTMKNLNLRNDSFSKS